MKDHGTGCDVRPTTPRRPSVGRLSAPQPSAGWQAWGMRRSFALLAGVLLTGVFTVPVSAADGDSAGDQGFTIKDPRITESSGLAASRLHPGIYWTHNDSDDGPYIYAVDSRTGKTVATLTLKGIGSPRDVEAISIGPGN